MTLDVHTQCKKLEICYARALLRYGVGLGMGWVGSATSFMWTCTCSWFYARDFLEGHDIPKGFLWLMKPYLKYWDVHVPLYFHWLMAQYFLLVKKTQFATKSDMLNKWIANGSSEDGVKSGACRISYAITWLLVSSWHVKLNATRIAEALYLCPIRFMESTLTDLSCW